MQEHIRQLFSENIQTMIATGESLAGPLENAACVIVNNLISGGKIICCGEGATSALANHFAQLLLDQFETERPTLPALALLPHNHSLQHCHQQDYLARQIKALGQSNDVLLVISLTGAEPSLIKAVEAALTNDMKVIALTVDSSGELSGLLNQQDVELKVPVHRPARIFECYTFLLHSLCELIDMTLFPQQGDL
ncbi:SIS domain-containing protein [Rheinheimera hassiensis]|uniref:SIS domain-containing protein n=1 Tax=Rheinheimera hassiensis TaxID=1193627 RepID=UPI001F064A33|nr:SIS domain-containing protein [Rheinheimera hassiensis]